MLDEWGEKHQIIGLLDSFRTAGEQFGYPILNIYDVIEQDDIIIVVVVARAGSCKAIAKKIGNLCRNHGVELYDIRGRNLLQSNPVVFDFRGIPGYKYSDIVGMQTDVTNILIDNQHQNNRRLLL